MSDLARYLPSREIMDAREVASDPELIPGPWQCPGCCVAMMPVACGSDDYRVSPHFRANGRHASECRYDGMHPDADPGEIRRIQSSMGPPESMPTRLRLVERRPQRRDSDPADPPAARSHIHRGRLDAAAPSPTHESTASMLHRIADAYCRYPSERRRRLRVPECAGRAYRECFQALKNTTGSPPFDRKVLFAPIRFRRPDVLDDVVTIELAPAVWLSPRDPANPVPPDAVYRVSFRTGPWSERDRRRFRRDLEKAISDQKRDHYDDQKHEARRSNKHIEKTWVTYLFFVGAQDPDDRALFTVDDHRLACFFRLHKDVYRNL